MSRQDLNARFMEVCALVTNETVPLSEVLAAIVAFRALEVDDPDQKERCIYAIEDTMECRSPDHCPGSFTPPDERDE